MVSKREKMELERWQIINEQRELENKSHFIIRERGKGLLDVKMKLSFREERKQHITEQAEFERTQILREINELSNKSSEYSRLSPDFLTKLKTFFTGEKSKMEEMKAAQTELENKLHTITQDSELELRQITNEQNALEEILCEITHKYNLKMWNITEKQTELKDKMIIITKEIEFERRLNKEREELEKQKEREELEKKKEREELEKKKEREELEKQKEQEELEKQQQKKREDVEKQIKIKNEHKGTAKGFHVLKFSGIINRKFSDDIKPRITTAKRKTALDNKVLPPIPMNSDTKPSFTADISESFRPTNRVDTDAFTQTKTYQTTEKVSERQERKQLLPMGFDVPLHFNATTFSRVCSDDTKPSIAIATKKTAPDNKVLPPTITDNKSSITTDSAKALRPTNRVDTDAFTQTKTCLTTENVSVEQQFNKGETQCDASNLFKAKTLKSAITRRANTGKGPDPDEYPMNFQKRGLAIIINNVNFTSGAGTRLGSDRDVEALEKQLNEMGFMVKTCTNCTVKKMQNELEQAAMSKENKDSDCFVCVILSHGENGTVCGTDDSIKIKDLQLPFKGDRCDGLRGKPKIFFIQACQGTEKDVAVEVKEQTRDRKGKIVTDGEMQHPNIPSEADFLTATSVVEGCVSFRNTETGSWFVQSLCDVLRENWRKMDLVTMLTRVNVEVAKYTDEKNGVIYKQMPIFTSTLTKRVVFREKVASLPDHSHSTIYSMNHKYRGKAVIINNVNARNYAKIKGSIEDVNALTDIFTTMGFKVSVYGYRSAKETENKLQEESQDENYHSNSDCFVCVILSHGDETFVMGNGEEININRLILPFKGQNCRALKGKPKLFFIQASQGEKPGTCTEEDRNAEVDSTHDADIFIVTSSVRGQSWDWYDEFGSCGWNDELGSRFIQTLCKILTVHWQSTNLVDILTIVNNDAEFMEKFFNLRKQIPCIISTLRKKVIFGKK